MSTTAESIGRVLAGRYRLESVLGTGASAHVFCAWDVTLRRRVAIKLLHPALASDASFLRRFRAEAQSAAALVHPHILSVFDWGEDRTGPFLVLEYLGGGSLRQLLDSGHRLSVPQAVAVGTQAAEGLAFAHSRGFVHRDVKPANLLFDDEGRLRVADFGLARALAEAAWTEPAGATVGTARYAAPEQALGRTVDGRADVYSLALVLYEAVTGVVPFTADTTLSTLMARVAAPLPEHQALGPLNTVLEEAAGPEADRRMSATELAGRLSGLAPTLPDPAPLPLTSPASSYPVAGVLAGRTVPDAHSLDTTEHPVAAQGESEDSPDALENGDQAGSGTLADEEHAELFELASAVGVADPPETPPSTRAEKGRRHQVRDEQRLAGPRAGRAWKWMAIFLILLVVAGAAAYGVVQSRILVPSHPVPKLANLTYADASKRLKPEHFKVAVSGHRYSVTVPTGSVVAQAPRAGRMIKEDSTVRVALSKGPPPVQVPSLASVTSGSCAAAAAALAPSHLQAKCVYQNTMQQPQGAVIDWNPKTVATEGSTIQVVISAGPPIENVPSLNGMTCAAATSTLQTVGLSANCVSQYTNGTPAGQVISGQWTPSDSAPEGSTVTVQISAGPPLVVVPAVPAGASVGQVETLLENANLNVGQLYGPLLGTVFQTDPSYPSSVPEGTTVNIYTG